MKRFKSIKKSNKNTMSKKLFIVFFFVLVGALLLFNVYAKKNSSLIVSLTNEKLDNIIYDFFNELITSDVINKESVNDILEINTNEKGEILAVNYNLEKSYRILTDVAKILKQGLNQLTNGTIIVSSYDNYLENGCHGLILNVPLFLSSKNVYLNNLGPKIPIRIDFNETILTNLKTKVTNYGFNNALLEVYITVEMQKLIITPMHKENKKFNYDILVGALVVNGQVPEFYGSEIISSSSILDIPIDLRV